MLHLLYASVDEPRSFYKLVKHTQEFLAQGGQGGWGGSGLCFTAQFYMDHGRP